MPESRSPRRPRRRRSQLYVALGLLPLLAVACRNTDNGMTTPNQPPGTPVIQSPTGGSRHAPGEEITFQGSAQDPEDGPLSGTNLSWGSSEDGVIGTGTSFTRDDLSEGVHTITLTATDSEGLSSVRSISIVIENLPPQASISTPDEGDSYGVGEAIPFQGTGTDDEDGSLTGPSLVWTSDLDGQIGTGTSFDQALSAGTHTITLTATDSHGATGSATVTITAENQPPSPTIANPGNGSTFLLGNQVGFQGSASDFEDGALTGGALIWTSSQDGQIGMGTSFNRPDLSLGGHTITLTATDSEGLDASTSVNITILGPPAAMIDLPTPGATFAEGAQVTFQGSATDPEDGNLAGGSLVWTSSRDGQIGTGTTFSRTDLSVGVHTITLTATDSDGLMSVKSLSITITGAGAAPTATIQTPANGSTFQSGAAVAFQGSGADPEDGPLTGGSLVWTSSRDGQIGTGTSFNRLDLSIGAHTITLTATDSDALTGTDQVDITIQGGPQVEITSPPGGSTFDAGTSIGFQGEATDAEDGDLTGASLVWTSDLDGQIGTGESFNKSDLSQGTHTITLTATDSDAFMGSDQITVTVQAAGSAPVASITSPTTGSSFDTGQNISFTGTGTDAEDGALAGGSLVWTSSIDGQIGTGTSFSRSDLAEGTHTITLTATDSDMRTGTAQITITVETGSAPTASITSPGSGTSVSVGTNVNFQGTASDADDGALTGGSLVWTSSIDGQIGTGTSFSRSALSVGTHTITLTATDSDGRTATDQVSLTINQTTPILVKAGGDASTNIGVGGQTSIPVIVDLSQAAGQDIASIQVRVTWNTAVAGYVSSSAGSFGLVTINDADAGTGAIVVSTFNTTGTTSTFTLFTLTLSGTASGTTNVSVEVQSAGDEGGADISGSVGTRSHGLTVGN